MRSARRQSIVIVGAGLAGLAAAFELTKPGRYPGADVTVYQMGWRLGGKCSSGRDQQGRIIEHGLHMWFGYYENAFRLLREVYEEWKPGANWRDVLKPQDFTPIGDTHGIDGGSFIPVHWPPRGGVPGDGRRASIWQGLVGVLELLAGFHEIMAREGDLTFAQAIVRIRPEAAQHFERFNRPIDAANELNLSAALQIALRWASDIESSAMTAADARGLKSLLRETTVVMLRHRHTVGDELLAQLSDIVVAFVCGVIDDVILERLEITQLDQLDFREWLILHGAHFDSAWQSSFVKALYDTMFQYVEGDISCPSYGAGTAAQVVLRMLGTYKSHAVWEAQGSLGELLVAPLYEVLENRGVRFEFFHKLVNIELADDKKAVARLHFYRQVAVDHGPYRPTFKVEGRTCWPAEPRWDCLENGDDLRTRKGQRRSCSNKVPILPMSSSPSRSALSNASARPRGPATNLFGPTLVSGR